MGDRDRLRRALSRLSDADRDYGTNFRKEVQKLSGKPYYTPRRLQKVKEQK